MIPPQHKGNIFHMWTSGTMIPVPFSVRSTALPPTGCPALQPTRPSRRSSSSSSRRRSNGCGSSGRSASSRPRLHGARWRMSWHGSRDLFQAGLILSRGFFKTYGFRAFFKVFQVCKPFCPAFFLDSLLILEVCKAWCFSVFGIKNVNDCCAKHLQGLYNIAVTVEQSKPFPAEICSVRFGRGKSISF